VNGNIDITLPNNDAIDLQVSAFQNYSGSYQITIPDGAQTVKFRNTDGKNAPSFTNYLTLADGLNTSHQNLRLEGQLDMSSGIVYFPNPSATNTVVWLAPGANPQALLPTNQTLAGTSILRLPAETTGTLATQAYVDSSPASNIQLNSQTFIDPGNTDQKY
jgi:hypothetical protein